jgi:competence protein ComEC
MPAVPAALLSALHACVDTVGGTPLLVCAAMGLLFGDALAASAATLPALPLAGMTAAAVWLVIASDVAWRRVGVVLLAAVAGSLAANRVYQPKLPRDHVALAAVHTPVDIEGVLAADPEPRGERTRLWLRSEQIDEGHGWRPTQGTVLVSVGSVEQRWSAGDRLRGTVSLRRPRNFGNPGEFDYVAYLARQGIYSTASADDDTGFVLVEHVESGISDWFARWRRGVGALVRQTLAEPQASVLSALVIGTAATLPSDLRAAFSRVGVSHVLSVSGLHIGLVAMVAYTLVRWLLARSRWMLLTANVPKLAGALSIIPVLLYAGIAGSNVATVRAVLMIAVFVAAMVVDRERHLIVSLAAAAIVILLTSPGSSVDISFQLSFVAVLGLVLAMERFWPWWRKWEEAHLLRLRGWRGRLGRSAAVYAVVSLSALAATTPLTALHFNQVSFVAVLANALVVPLLGSLAVALGLLGALLFLVSETLAWLCLRLAGPVVQLGLWLVQFFAAWPYAAVRVVTPTLLEVAVIYAVLLAFVRLSGRARRVFLIIPAAIALADGTWWYVNRYYHREMRLTFLSVGLGDAAVVELPGAEVMVIDGGGLGGEAFDVGERIVAPFLWSRKIAHVDYIVLSHPDRDHYGGLAFVAAQFSPREFWSNGASSDSEGFARLERRLRDGGVSRQVLLRGAVRRIGSVEVHVHSPSSQRDGLRDNDQSLVLSLGFGGTHVLFTGDIEAPGEEDLVASSDGQLASAVLKVPHHGSQTSSSARFLDAVAPQFAIVSAGFENRFGFPHPEVLRRYDARDCTLARTDLDGAVTVRIHPDGQIDARRFRDASRGAGACWTWKPAATHRGADHRNDAGPRPEIAVDSPSNEG